MRIAYLDCFSGISGDMFVAAFLDSGVSLDGLKTLLECLPVKGWRVSADRTKRGSFAATRFTVECADSAKERHLSDVLRIVETSGLPSVVKKKTRVVFLALAEAEARAHGVTTEEVHFHEVGALDSIIDVVGAVSCLHLAGVERLYVSTLSLGRGSVATDHGLIPLPAPATSFLLRDHNIRLLNLEAELVTPTGAALVSCLGEQVTTPVPFKIESVGHGAGSRELAGLPNIARVLVGSEESSGREEGLVEVLETNIDDMNPQIYGYLQERLFEMGALEVFFAPVQMKKGRPGVLLTVLCEPGASRSLGEEILRQTSTLGLRISVQRRMELARETQEVPTAYGPIRMKVPLAFPEKASPEYEDCKLAAGKHGVSLLTVLQAAKTAWHDRLRANRSEAP
ncbi:MAG: nickel pincer cofactor biosynthesis protein LarC [Candidatus Eisenbacteria bacterium]